MHLHILRFSLLWLLVTAAGGPLVPAAGASGLQTGMFFTDGMVLPRDQPVPLSGTDRPGQRVEVQFAGHLVRGQADATGHWTLSLPPLSPSARGRPLILRGSSTVVLEDVVVGDVWLAAGQSNMAWTFAQSGLSPAWPEGLCLRLFDARPRVGTRADHIYGPDDFRHLVPGAFYDGAWDRPDARGLRRHSAVARSFGVALARALRGSLPDGGDLPIGIIELAVGGTTTEAFIPPAVLRETPILREAFRAPREVGTLGRWAARRIAANLRGYHHPHPDRPHPHPFAPGFLFHAGVEALTDLPVTGVIWYQGESNADFSTAPRRWNGTRILELQAGVMDTLIHSWREAFDAPDLPFYIVQLPRIHHPERAAWPWYRAAQDQVARRLPGVELAVLPECGSAGGNVHPPDKEPVGRRLAAIALDQVYGQPHPWRGPAHPDAERRGAEILLRFDPATGPLALAGEAPLRHFEIAGPNRRFVPAQVRRLDDHRLIVHADPVPRPVAVRYGWDMHFAPSLLNTHGLSAAPFRTDAWRVAPGRRIRIACIGDSITQGAGLSDPTREAYPGQLQTLLDADLFEVRNFGRSGAGIVRPKNKYDLSPQHREALAFQPDVVLCNLGINDVTLGESLPRQDFLREYDELLTAYRALPTGPVLVLWQRLSPLFPGQRFYGSPQVERINQWIGQAAERQGALTLDMYQGLADRPDWYPDHLHPNAEGAAAIARRTARFLERIQL